MSGDSVMLWKKRGLNHIPGPGHKDTHTHRARNRFPLVKFLLNTEVSIT